MLLKKLNTPHLYIISGHIGFAILLLLSIVFYKERIVFNDTVFQFFKIVNFEKLNIEASRYGVFITQLPLLVFLKTNVGLKTLVLVYSLSFVFVYYIIFIVCTHILKNPTAGISILFSLIISIAQSFYHPCTETHQAIVYSILLYAILHFSYRRKWQFLKYVLSFLAIMLSFYCHPVALFTALFVIGLNIVEQKNWKSLSGYYLILFTVVLAILKVKFTKETSYEGNFINELLKNDLKISSVLRFYSLHFFVSRFMYLFFLVSIMFLVSLIIYLGKKEYLKLSYLAISVFFFFLITLITYSKGDADVMMERSFMPLTVFMVLPFFISVKYTENPLKKTFLVAFILLVFLISLKRIIHEGKINSERIAYINELLDKTKNSDNRKFLLQKTPENNQRILYTWPFSYTTLIISSMEGNNNCRTIFLCNKIEDYIKYTLDNTGIFLGTDFWLEWKTADLNHRYFYLPENQYAVLNSD